MLMGLAASGGRSIWGPKMSGAVSHTLFWLLLLSSLVKLKAAPLSLHVSLIGIMAAPSVDTAFHLLGHLHTYFVFSLVKCRFGCL